MKLTIEVPQLEDLPKGQFTPEQAQKVREAIAAQCYGEGFISEKQACDLTDLNRREFQDILSFHGSSVSLSDDPEIIKNEFNQK